MTIEVRSGSAPDADAIRAIYNHFIHETAITFDVEPWSPEVTDRWLSQFASTGPHRLFVADSLAGVVGFACSHSFRTKAAYATTVETTIYLHPSVHRQGVGCRLYEALFDSLASEDLHRAYAGVTLPNPASVGLHQRCGFREVGTFREVGRKFGNYWDVMWLERAL